MLSEGDLVPFNLPCFKGVAKKGAGFWQNNLLPYFLNSTTITIYCFNILLVFFFFTLNILPAYILQFGVYLTSTAKKMTLSYIKSWPWQSKVNKTISKQIRRGTWIKTINVAGWTTDFYFSCFLHSTLLQKIKTQALGIEISIGRNFL